MYLLRRLRGLFGPNPVFSGELGAGPRPYRGSKEAAGLDLHAIDEVLITPGSTVVITTGLKCKFNSGWVALLWDRSRYGVRGLHTYAGVIDSDYRGEWGVVIHNSTPDTVVIQVGDRVAQVVFQRCWIGKVRWGVVKNDTSRGTGGFGSTGE